MNARARIVDVASRTFGRDGVLGARMEDIRRDAGVSVGAVYHHFPDKESLHAEAWLMALADYQRRFIEVLEQSEGAEDGVKAVVRFHLSWTCENQEAAALLQTSRPAGTRAAEQLREQNRAFLSGVLRWWRIHAAYGTLRDLDPEVIHAIWLGPVDSYSRHLVEGHVRAPVDSVVRELADTAWMSLKGGDRQ